MSFVSKESMSRAIEDSVEMVNTMQYVGNERGPVTVQTTCFNDVLESTILMHYGYPISVITYNEEGFMDGSKVQDIYYPNDRQTDKTLRTMFKKYFGIVK